MRLNNRSILWGSALALALAGCSNHPSSRALKDAQPEVSGIPDSALKGTFYYLKSISDLRYPGKEHQEVAGGTYLDSNKLVTFEVKEGRLNVLQVEPKLSSHGRENPIVASFPIHRQVTGGIEINVLQDAGDPFTKDAVLSSVVEAVVVDPFTGSLRFTTERQLNDDTIIDQRYSFLPAPATPTFAPRPYPRDEQSRFGFFKTTVYEADQYNRITQNGVKEFVDHWDTNQTITYYLSKNFPARLEPVVDDVFKAWNAAFTQAVGHPVLKWQRNSGQEPGDLRYSMIVYVDSDSGDSLLGYGPQFADPRTGQILKGDVFLFGGSLRQELFTERVWARQLGNPPTATAQNTTAPLSLNGIVDSINPLASLVPVPSELDTAVLAQFAQSYTADHRNPLDLDAEVAASRTLLDSELNRETTRVSPAARLNLAARATEMNDDQLELRIFQPVLAHELGHTFGLRHNFEASADAARFPEGGNTTSEMDYPLVGSDNVGKPGPYDVAALQYGYSPNDQVRGNALAQNYLFCTDGDLNNVKNALCNQHDSGTTLSEVVRSEANLYQTMYIFNNHRLDRVSFTASLESYRKATLSRLLPLRLAYENANSILASGNSLAALWSVTRQRIEADAKTDPSNVLTLKLKLAEQMTLDNGQAKVSQSTVTRRIDKAKIEGVLRDARQAKELAYTALEQLVFDSKRPESNVADIDTGDLQVRGILPDKMAALTLLCAPLNGSTPYTTMAGNRAQHLLNALISNTLPQQIAATKKLVHAQTQFNPALRVLALDILANKLAKPGSTASAREQLNVVSVPVTTTVLTRAATLQANVEEAMDNLARDTLTTATTGGLFPGLALPVSLGLLPNQIALSKLRAEQQQFLSSLPFDTRVDMQAMLDSTDARTDYLPALAQEIQVMANGDEPSKQVVTQIAQNEVAMMQDRDKADTAYTLSGEHFWKAPMASGGVETATGLLVRDNINVMEDRLMAVTSLTTQFNAAFQAEQHKAQPDQQKLQGMSVVGARINSLHSSLINTLANERQLVEKIHTLYQQAVN